MVLGIFVPPLLGKNRKNTYNIHTSFVTLRYLNVTEVKIFVTLNEISVLIYNAEKVQLKKFSVNGKS